MDDLISRQAAIDALHMHLMYRMGTDSNKKRLDEWVNSLPPAQKPGHWMPINAHTMMCSICGEFAQVETPYCPNCGADMSEKPRLHITELEGKMKRSDDYTMQGWRDYYAEKERKAESNYQNSGVVRYDRERYRYGKIVEAFDGYLELKRLRREAKNDGLNT